MSQVRRYAAAGLDAAAWRSPAGHLGALLEGFAAMELPRQLTWSRQRAELSHYRTRDNAGADLVLENRRGRVVTIEVKVSSSPIPRPATRNARLIPSGGKRSRPGATVDRFPWLDGMGYAPVPGRPRRCGSS